MVFTCVDMTQQSRVLVLASLSAAILAVLLLAAGLSKMELQTGTLFSSNTLEELRFLISQFDILQGWLVVLYIVAPIFVLLYFRRRRNLILAEQPIPRKRRSLPVIILQAVMWAVAIMIVRSRMAEGSFFLTPPNIGEMPAMTPAGAPQGVTANVPDWISYLSSFVFVFLVLLVVWIVWRRRQASAFTLEMVTKEAQFAIDELQAGEDLGDVILKCYYEMARALDQHRSVRRKEGMTPREFEGRLIKLGLPEEPVSQLTRLFESVRYGAKKPGKDAESQAIVCLDEIVKFGREVA